MSALPNVSREANPLILGRLDSFGLRGQFREARLERLSDSPNGAPSWVDAASLEMRDPRRVYVGAVTELFLAQAELFPCLPNSPAEGDLRLDPSRHGRDRAGRAFSTP